MQLLTGSGPEVEQLSAHMQRAWVSFASTGDPGHDGIGEWRTWHPVGRSTMVFGADSRLVDGPRNEELAALEAHRPLLTHSPD